MAERNPQPLNTFVIPVALTAKGGYQAEFNFYLTGLDIDEKGSHVGAPDQGAGWGDAKRRPSRARASPFAGRRTHGTRGAWTRATVHPA